jgi:hypothetical protein
MSHTPGPWEAEHEQCDPKPSPDDPGFFAINAPILNRYGPVADTMNRDHCISPDEDRDNAMLIAAAPELLAALDPFKRLADIMQTLGLPDDTPVRECAPGVWPTLGDCRRARAAIAKATA